MRIGNLASDPKFASSEERNFALFSVEEHESEVVRNYLYGMIGSWIPLAIMWYLKLIDNTEVKILFSFHLLLGIFSYYILKSRWRLDIKRRIVYSLVLLTQSTWCLTAMYGPNHGDWGRPLMGTWITLILFSNAFLPVRSFAHNAMFVFSIATCVLGLENYFERDLALIIITTCLFLGQNYCIYTQRMIKSAAIARYREQVRYIPKNVLFTAEKKKISVLDVFSPAERYCVCICSDWRQFQKLAKSVSMDDLSNGLADYYQKLLEQVAQILPDGNFFFDWIADELFLVVFATDNTHRTKVAREAMIVSRRILEFRYEFYSKFGFPVGIDIGVSSGTASVGIFSSGAIVKATAFGHVPAEARRLQEVAKSLRKIYSDTDRIVMTATFAQEAGIPENDCSRVGGVSHQSRNVCLTWPAIAQKEDLGEMQVDSENREFSNNMILQSNEGHEDSADGYK